MINSFFLLLATLQKTVKNPPPAKKATVKPKTGILINKNEPVLVNKVQQDVPEVNHFEKSHPKDVIEIHREAIEAKEKEKEKEKVVRKPKKVDEVQIVKKKKSDNLAIAPPASITVPVNSQSEEETEIASLIRSLGKAELTRNQIQILIDFLLNKQQDTVAKEPTEWSEGKTDVLQKLKKQLSEKEEQLRNEQASLLALTAKLKELRNEYNTEKSQFNATLKAHIEEIHAKNLEIRNLSQTHVAEKQSLSLQFQQIQQKYLKIQQMKDENLKTIQQLTESNNCLQQQIMFSHQHEESFKSLLAQKDSEICIVKQGNFFDCQKYAKATLLLFL
jgi:ribosome-binding protein 1